MCKEKVSSVSVDIAVCTYNHEKYIAQTIEGAISQITNFSIRMLIGEDASTDNTRTIVESYQKKYPDIIFPFYREKNIGPFINSKLIFNECKSKYIALCDGDDYWTDPYKLQKQIDYMEGHPDCSMTFHDVLLLYEETKKTAIYKFDTKNALDFEYVSEYCGSIAMTCSIVIRNYFEKLEKGWENVIYDQAIHCFSLMNGYIHHMGGIMGVYRITGEGMYSKMNDKEVYMTTRKNIRNKLIKHFDKRFHLGFRKSLFKVEYKLSLSYFDSHKFLLFLKYQYYAIIGSLSTSGFKYTFDLIKHTFKYVFDINKHYGQNQKG